MTDLFKRTEDFLVSVEAEASRIEKAKLSLITESENTLLNKFITFYGNGRLAEVTTADLNRIETETLEGIAFDGSISVIANVLDTVGEKTITVTLPVKANQLDLLSDEELQKMVSEATAQEAVLEMPVIEATIIEASLSDFSIIDDGSDYLKVFHPAIDSGRELGVISKVEYSTATNKEALLTSVLFNNVKNTNLENNHELQFTGSFVEPSISVEAEKPWEKPWEKKEDEEETKEDESEEKEDSDEDDSSFLAHQSDSYRQAITSEDQAEHAQFERTASQAVTSLVSHLQKLNYGSVRILAVDISDATQIAITSSLFDEVGEKIVSISIPVTEHRYSMPTKEALHKVISETVDLRTKIAEEFEKDTLEHIKAIDDLETYNVLATEASLADETITKIATDSGGMQYLGPVDVLQIDKHTIGLPDDTEIGTKAYVDGFWWQLTSKDKNNLSKEADSGSLWTFTKISPEKGEPDIIL